MKKVALMNKLFIGIICLAVGVFIGQCVRASTTVTIPEFSMVVECEAGIKDCPDCPDCPDFPVLKCPAGNYHGASHPDRAIKFGYDSCMKCHSPDNPVLVGKDSVICTQYNPPPENIGRTIIDPVTGEDARDPYTNDKLVGSNHLYILKQGDQVVCSNCHNPHRGKQDYFVEEEELIHPGCLDCHVKPGSDDLKGEDDDDDDNGNGGSNSDWEPSEDNVDMSTCRSCHRRTPKWKDENHKNHDEKKISCERCHKE